MSSGSSTSGMKSLTDSFCGPSRWIFSEAHSTVASVDSLECRMRFRKERGYSQRAYSSEKSVPTVTRAKTILTRVNKLRLFRLFLSKHWLPTLSTQTDGVVSGDGHDVTR